jgi:hypothetical protein
MYIREKKFHQESHVNEIFGGRFIERKPAIAALLGETETHLFRRERALKGSTGNMQVRVGLSFRVCPKCCPE